MCVNGSSSSSGGRPPATTDSAAALTDVVDYNGVDVDSMTTDVQLKMPLSEDKAEVFPVYIDTTVMAEGQMLM